MTDRNSSPADRLGTRRRRASPGTGFWLVAYAFTIVMAFSAVPTPLYVVYAARDHFSGLTVTLVYAVYAVGVIASLFLLGHLSDRFGRRRVLMPAVAVSVLAGLVFVLWTSLPALLIARVLSGVAVGMVTTTATAHLGELHARRRPGQVAQATEATQPARPAQGARLPQLVAVAANLGGIGAGPLVAGMLAQFAPRPLLVPYVVMEALLLLGLVGLWRTPETVTPPSVRTPYHPQRIVVPREGRARFAAACLAALVTFSAFGLFTSLAPSFLAHSLRDPSHALAGGVVFAVFASAAITQAALLSLRVRTTLLATMVLVPLGLAGVVAATWTGSLAAFVLGGAVTGAGAGLAFKGALAAAIEVAPPTARAEALAGFFLSGYIGLSVPIVLLGIVGEHVSTRVEVALFGAVAAAAMVATAAALLPRRPPATTDDVTGE
ncbi:MAG: MFS transporter, partial [Acidimicrobiales bacterium]